MKRLLLLLAVAIITFVIVLFVQNPALLDRVWLWIVGLIGLIIQVFRRLGDAISRWFEKDPKEQRRTNEAHRVSLPEEEKPSPRMVADVQLQLLRYSDDGETTLGLLHVNGTFYCYTLEDTYQETKIAGQTRIPAGIYSIAWRKELTELTQTYQNRYPDWFTYHLHIQKVPEFSAIYLHSGGDHTQTEGCILVSDSLSATDKQAFLTNSRTTFERLYKYLEAQLEVGKTIQIEIRDEAWAQQLVS